MSSSEDSLALWSRVEKTNPAYTKKVNVGGHQITSIAPQYQILNATREFGPYGKSWGFRRVTINNELAMSHDVVTVNCLFFFPGGEFEIISSIKLHKDNAKTKVDDDFAKKVETDALTKALSKLGFNADIFLGRFDDVKYVEEVTAEFERAKTPTITKEQESCILDALKYADYPLENFLVKAQSEKLKDIAASRYDGIMAHISKVAESGNATA